MTSRIFLTEAQANYLNQLSSTAAAYRGSWESLANRGQDELDRLNAGQWVSGPNHQVMSEIDQEYGKIKMALNLIWSIFSVEKFHIAEAQNEAKAEIDGFLRVAMGEPKKSASINGGTWFSEGKTFSDYL